MERWRTVTSAVCGAAAAIFLAAMMLLTVADVALRSFFNLPIRGVYDLVELLLAGTFFVALPAVFLRDENIVVNSIDDFWPRAGAAPRRRVSGRGGARRLGRAGLARCPRLDGIP